MIFNRSPNGSSWDILFYIKQKYPNIFGNKESSLPQTSNFEDLLASTTWDQKSTYE